MTTPAIGTDGSSDDDVAAALARLSEVLDSDGISSELAAALRDLPTSAERSGVEDLQVVTDSRHAADRPLVRGATLSDSRLVTLSAPTIDLAIDIIPDARTRRAWVRGVVLPVHRSGPFVVSLGLRRRTCDGHGQFRIDDLPFGSYSGSIEEPASSDAGGVRPSRLLARFTLIVD